MRLIKFRAWDNDCGEYYYSDKQEEHIMWYFYGSELGINTENLRDTNPGGMGHVQEYHWVKADVTIEQFTGIMDKNGKEIYEGDVLAKKSDAQYQWRVRWDNVGLGFTCHTYRLELDDDEDLFLELHYGNHALKPALLYDNHIIGNIHTLSPTPAGGSKANEEGDQNE